MDSMKEVKFVSQILQMTQAKDLVWRRRDPPQSLWLGTDYKIFDFYTSKLNDKILGIYEVRYPAYDGDRDKAYWSTTLELALFDSLLNHEYTFTVLTAVRDLYDEVKRQVSGVDDFLDSVLGDKK